MTWLSNQLTRAIYLAEFIKEKNSDRVCLSDSKDPRTVLVVVVEPTFSTPRMTIHI